MIAAALSLALFSGLAPHHAQAAKGPPVLQRARLGGWTYEIRTDSFTGAKACRLYGRDAKSGVHMTYVPSAVAFQFGGHLDTQAAVYRVDDGAPRASRDDATTLALSHVVTPDPALNQSAQGLVIIPHTALSGAHQVAIRPSPNVRPRMVGLGGLQQMLTAAEAQGCTTSSFAQLDLQE